MKEFTLNADFGMTASDDGFALYGIHTGDMIMFKAAEDFPTNGSLVAVLGMCSTIPLPLWKWPSMICS